MAKIEKWLKMAKINKSQKWHKNLLLKDIDPFFEALKSLYYVIGAALSNF